MEKTEWNVSGSKESVETERRKPKQKKKKIKNSEEIEVTSNKELSGRLQR